MQAPPGPANPRSLVWSNEAQDRANPDQWFDRRKTQIGLCLAHANVGFRLLDNASGIYSGPPPMLVPPIAGAAALPFTRTRRQSAVELALLVICLAWVVGLSTVRMTG